MLIEIYFIGDGRSNLVFIKVYKTEDIKYLMCKSFLFKIFRFLFVKLLEIFKDKF